MKREMTDSEVNTPKHEKGLGSNRTKDKNRSIHSVLEMAKNMLTARFQLCRMIAARVGVP